MKIRKVKEEEMDVALDLVSRVFLEFEAPDYTEEGIKEFKKAIDDKEWVSKRDFWGAFDKALAKDEEKLDRKYRRKLEKEINRFYQEDFFMTRYVTHPTDLVNDVVEILKQKGYQLVVATNPIFPAVATEARLSWTGLEPDDFSLITTFENSCFSKPNLDYYRHLLKTLDKDPEDCLMVGNDVQEDMCARHLGIDVFLLDEFVLNEKNEDVFELKKGNWRLFKEYVSALPDLN